MKKLLIIALSTLAFSTFAGDLSAEDSKRIDAKLAPLAKEMKAGNLGATIDTMPPAFFDIMAKEMGTNAEALKKMLTEQSGKMLENVSLEAYEYDLSKAQAETSEKGRDYAFIPVKTTMTVMGNKMSQDGYMLGVEDGDEWYFINWMPQYAPVVEKLYPDLKDLKAPK